MRRVMSIVLVYCYGRYLAVNLLFIVKYDISLVMDILQGLRETPIPVTPAEYVKIYTGKI